MAEETPNQNNSDAFSASAQRRHSIPTSTSRVIDMSLFEAMLADVPEGPGPQDVAGCCSVVPQPRQPSVEWAIVWADGRLTTVETEAAARFVADRNPATTVACRIVGSWGPPDLS
ncbi:MAG TPA: hypothetical protein VHN80_15665 [Kineosporiaceae bacterium]|nr:hypothetical protein [Kineosporiaceae bacterium]